MTNDPRAQSQQSEQSDAEWLRDLARGYANAGSIAPELSHLLAIADSIERRGAELAEYRRAASVDNPQGDATHYPHPEHGWTCFHCGDTFHVQAKAREHFGQTPDSEPGCVLKLTAEDRQLLRRLRAQEIINAELTTDLHNETTLSQHHSHATRTELMGFKPFRQCSTVQDAFNVYDSMEGRALAAEESLTATRAERDAAQAETARLKLSQSEMYGSGKKLEADLRQRAQDAEAERDALAALVREAAPELKIMYPLHFEKWLARADEALRAPQTGGVNE